ncbi:hypothetical protein ADL28_01680 [Streptomyces violaceusniger]|uniref:Uncharacterized protein n=1 Tax=Streptomyces violaceusniger TaxID=68280 RepID=A0A0X3XDC0_STRVO|nr:hypothetical protein ADL28_01680 [Streptomyces violaceusniger]
MLGAGDTGDVSVPAEATYADGSTGTLTIRLTGWIPGPAYGETEAVRASRIHTCTGPLGTTAAIFHQVGELDPARNGRRSR